MPARAGGRHTPQDRAGGDGLQPRRTRQPRRWNADDDRTPCYDCGATCCGPADPTGTDAAFDTCQYGVTAFGNPIFTNPNLAVKQGSSRASGR